MNTIINGVNKRQNVILTSLAGVERTRFLLKCGQILVSQTNNKQESFSRIFYVVQWDADVNRTSNEAKSLSFEETNVKVGQVCETCSETQSSDNQTADIIVTTMEPVLSEMSRQRLNLPSTDKALIIFDGIPLDSIEGKCRELNSEADGKANHVFGLLARKCWSIVLACNRPIEGIEAGLDCQFPISIDQDLRASRDYRVFASVVTKGPASMPMSFVGSEKRDGIHDEVGSILEQYSKRLDSGGIVIFFSSYGKMIEYHNHWQKSGLFERIGLPCARENRGEGKLKEMLMNFSKQKEKKSIALISYRFHQNIHYSDFVLSSSARLVLLVGLPYPFMNEYWEAKMKLDGGSDLYRYRAIEYMNGVMKRCLGEYRHQDVTFTILDESIAGDRDKLTQELDDVQVGDFDDSIKRFELFLGNKNE